MRSTNNIRVEPSVKIAGLVAALFLALFATVACSSSGGDDAGATCTGGGGPVTGSADDHCIDSTGAAVTQAIGVCSADGSGGEMTGTGGMTGSGGMAGMTGETFDLRYGNVAYDDDCKYSVSFQNTCVGLNTPVTFTVTLKRKTDGSAASGAVPDSPEIYLADDHSHISPSNNIKAPEGPSGVYAVGPIVFDKSGRWVVRFHFFESCSDVPEDSPHGHVAFYINVP